MTSSIDDKDTFFQRGLYHNNNRGDEKKKNVDAKKKRNYLGKKKKCRSSIHSKWNNASLKKIFLVGNVGGIQMELAQNQIQTASIYIIAPQTKI